MRRTLAALLVAAAAAACLAPAGAASAAVAAPRLVVADDFPDPDVLAVDGTYYAYSTNNGHGNVPVATANSLNGPWTRRPDALPTLGSWASGGLTWAPDVSRRADGRYLLYYTAHSTAAGRQCIGSATAASPLGPFAPSAGPLVCNAGEGGDIDPSSFTDSTGVRYLVYKDDGNAVGQPTNLWLQQVAADGVTPVGGRTELLRSDRAEEAGVIEAPVLTKVGQRYVLFYSLGGYAGDGYQTGYATATSLTGPYTKAYRSLVTTASVNSAVHGPGGADVVRGASGGDYLVFHGWINGNSARGLYVAELGWAGEYPVVRGSRVRYEAERGSINHASARAAATASQGQVVAYLDYADSWVEMSVYAPRSGGYTVYIGYAAGYGDAQHTLTVNGGAARTVTYPNTGWDNWQQVGADVTLNAGFNTVRLTFLSRWAEVDYVEVA